MEKQPTSAPAHAPQHKHKKGLTVREMVIAGLFAALIYAAKIVMAGLPNIEPVTLLLILYTIHFRKLAPYIVAVYVLLEGLTFGFGIWWVSYVYIWPLLVLIAYLMRKNDSVLIWAVVAGAFGLCFGLLCAIPWAVSGGISVGVAYWISGIPFDISHCIGNFVLMLLLYHPLSKCFVRLR